MLESTEILFSLKFQRNSNPLSTKSSFVSKTNSTSNLMRFNFFLFSFRDIVVSSTPSLVNLSPLTICYLNFDRLIDVVDTVWLEHFLKSFGKKKLNLLRILTSTLDWLSCTILNFMKLHVILMRRVYPNEQHKFKKILRCPLTRADKFKSSWDGNDWPTLSTQNFPNDYVHFIKNSLFTQMLD